MQLRQRSRYFDPRASERVRTVSRVHDFQEHRSRPDDIGERIACGDAISIDGTPDLQPATDTMAIGNSRDRTACHGHDAMVHQVTSVRYFVPVLPVKAAPARFLHLAMASMAQVVPPRWSSTPYIFLGLRRVSCGL
jgi:hypothetical protein